MNFSPKRPGETEVFTVDYVNLLRAGEAIQSANWANSVLPGAATDPSPAAMISGAASITGSQVSTILTGGIAGVTYQPLCTAITNMGQVLILPNINEGSLSVE